MEVLSISTEKTKELAGSLATKLPAGSVLALYGDLGSGKTTFTRFLVSALGSESRVQSPTFVLAKKYTAPNLVINHLDLYRLQNKEEILDLGLLEILNEPKSITVIEWPEIAEAILPKERLIKIIFSYKGENERKIEIQNID